MPEGKASEQAWNDALALITFLEPNLCESQRYELLEAAARQTLANSARQQRRQKRPGGLQRLLSWRRGEPILVGWQLDDDEWMYCWTLRSIVRRFRDRPECALPSAGQYLCAVVSSGVLGPKEKDRPRTVQWLAAAFFDILFGLDQRQAGESLFPRLFEGAAPLSLGGGFEGYRQTARRVQLEVARWACLKVVGGTPGYPQHLATETADQFGNPQVTKLRRLTQDESKVFWQEFWPSFEPRDTACGGPDSALFHTLLSGPRLRLMASSVDRKATVHLPVGVKVPMTADDPPPPSPKTPKTAEIRRKFYEDDRPAAYAAHGRISLSIDGGPPRDWNPSEVYRAQRSIELSRGGHILFWHEVDGGRTEADEVAEVTYGLGDASYTFRESRQGVELLVEEVSTSSAATPRPRLRSWKWQSALATMLGGILLALLALPGGMVRNAEAETKAETDALAPRTQTGRVRISRTSSPRPWIRYSFRVTGDENKAGGSWVVCPVVPGAVWTFDCGDKWFELRDGQLHAELEERIFGFALRRYKTLIHKNSN